MLPTGGIFITMHENAHYYSGYDMSEKIKNSLYAVILAGGRGERFWPVSRAASPKQFVSLFGGRPLIRLAVERLDGLIPPERIVVVTSSDLVERSRKALPMLPEDNVIGEPFGRDTAAACALGTAWAAWKGGDSATVAVLTADHLMKDAALFRRTLADTAGYVNGKGLIGVIGIRPQYPATGFGYIRSEAPLASGCETRLVKVAGFVEKPELAVAREYVESGRYYWNSGMFMWDVSTFREAAGMYCPGLLAMMDRIGPSFGSESFGRELKAAYESLEKISVDYAVMEKADNIIAAEGGFGWDDVGTWTSAGKHFDEDADGNRAVGRYVSLDSSRNVIVNCEDGHLLAVLGAEDMIVVHTGDATLVCSREATSDMKALLRKMNAGADADYV